MLKSYAWDSHITRGELYKMKITRKELRRLIAEMARTPMKDPTKDMDPEVLDKIQKGFYDSGDEESINQGDELAAALGGPD